jgi:hypothetical protein
MKPSKQYRQPSMTTWSQEGQQRVGDVGWGCKPQRAGDMRQEIGGCIVDGIVEFNHPPSVFENLRSGIGQPQSPRGTFYQTHPKLILQVRDAAAYSRGRHFENAGRS